MGSERASSVRQRYAGKICCECKAPLPPPHRRGERLCDRCGGAGKKRVYMHFLFRKGWFCQFLEEDLKTPLPKTIQFTDDKKIWGRGIKFQGMLPGVKFHIGITLLGNDQRRM